MLLDFLNTAATYADPLSKIATGFAALGGGWLWLSKLAAIQAEAMTGEWTNEGDVSGPPCTHSVSLTTEVTGRHVGGTVQAWEAVEHSPYASISGWRCGPFMRVRVIHVRQGEVSVLGTITMRFRQRGPMRFLSFRYSAPNTLYPKRAELWDVPKRPKQPPWMET
ncbi:MULTISPECIES: hypothetical protein [unclassified Caballeronia]|uniref:hypothetical protein n=1 Tax=unclassified Caballeronia TaxID=2646786 RepID=UPI00285F72B3|nr:MULTISPECIES: hypothetical protein [unclassified Caballeronia]MDR5751093.1 hypothetical protein [Caballeronia sp. LZ024]MDR5844770.1 hypothetical protein [Caballeronia sp. LZ031]